MSEKRFEDEVCCSNCKNQMTGFDGGFFGLPCTCECRIYSETENRKNCSDFEKKITKSYLLDKIKELEKENEQLKKEYKIAIDEMVTDYKKLEKENEQLRKENEEYEKESEDMQTKINVLYNEAKKHMSSTEWKNFNRRIIEREEELGIKWVRL